jgi:DNA-binding PadR family transcriptional regulator
MGRSKAFSNPTVPLTPPIFYMLMTLAQKDRHGYDIMKQVLTDSQGKVKLGPGTLYGAIKRMLEEKLIIELPNTVNERRRYYRLTDKGRQIFSNELTRYREAIDAAKRHDLIGQQAIAKLALIFG